MRPEEFLDLTHDLFGPAASAEASSAPVDVAAAGTGTGTGTGSGSLESRVALSEADAGYEEEKRRYQSVHVWRTVKITD